MWCYLCIVMAAAFFWALVGPSGVGWNTLGKKKERKSKRIITTVPQRNKSVTSLLPLHHKSLSIKLFRAKQRRYLRVCYLSMHQSANRWITRESHDIFRACHQFNGDPPFPFATLSFALTIVYMFSRVWSMDLAHVTCCKFSRAFHRLHVSHSCHRLHVFLPVRCHPQIRLEQKYPP